MITMPSRWTCAALISLSSLVTPGEAFPCGLCHEDNRSAVYSYEAVQKAKANPDKLEFAVFKIVGPLDAATAKKLQQWLQGRKGIDPATVKVSTSQKSMGFVMEKSIPKESLITELNREFPELRVHALSYN